MNLLCLLCRVKFGLYQVNFTDPARTRTPKASVAFFQEVAKTRRIPMAHADFWSSCLNNRASHGQGLYYLSSVFPLLLVVSQQGLV